MRTERVDWIDIPEGVLLRGTPADDVPGIAARYADTGVPIDWYRKRLRARRSVSPPSGSHAPRSPSASGGDSPWRREGRR